MRNIYNSLVAIIIFLIPTNFFLKFLESSAYVNGLKVDYLIPKLYLSDIFIILLIGLCGLIWLRDYLLDLDKYKARIINKNLYFYYKIKNKILNNNKNKFKSNSKTKINLKQKLLFSLTIALLIIFITKQLTSNHSISAVIYLLRIIELGLFTVFLHKNKKLIKQQIIEKSILFTLFFQSSIAIYQYLAQKSLFGYLLLGEPNLNNYIGIAKSTLFGVEKILPYGTTAHPNVLGGFIAVYLIILASNNANKVKPKTRLKIIELTVTIIIVSLSIFVLTLTQSISAFLTLIIGIGLIVYKNIKSPKITDSIGSTNSFLNKLNLKNGILILFIILISSVVSINLLAKKYPNNHSLTRRSYLNTAAISMTANNLLTGVGLNNFTAELEKFSTNREVVRFVQPVHNIFLLFFAETGLVGSLIVGLFVYFYSANIGGLFENRTNLKKHHKQGIKKDNINFSWIIILLPIALLDHYLVTIQTGLLILVFTNNYKLNKY